ncbi:MAG: amino acid ABC transporter substrate-binding protein [Candidatus Velthaea sp.]
MIRRRSFVLSLGALAATTGRASGAKRVATFGAAVALSGPLATEGTLTKEGYDFWMNSVNAHGGLRAGSERYQIDIRYEDDKSNAATTAQILDRMIASDHIDFVLGPYGSAATFAAAAVSERHRVPIVSSGGSAERIFNQGYSYTFGVQSPARKYLTGIIEYAVRRSPRPATVAIVAASDPFSLEVQAGAVQSANDHGIHVAYAERYTDDPASIAAAAAAIKSVNPDIVLNAGHLQDALQIHRALKENRVAAKIYGYSVGPDTPEFRAKLGSDAQAVLSSAQWSSAVTYAGAPGFFTSAREYSAAFAKAFGHAPDYHNAEASAAGLAYQYAIERAGSLDRDAVRGALAKLDVVTFFGLLKFDSRGVNVFKPMVVNQIQGSKLVTIYPYRLSDGVALYPAPAWK